MNLIHIFRMIIIVIISFLGYRLTRDFIKYRQMNKVKESIWKKKLKETEKGYFSYLRVEEFLIKNGRPLKLNPYSFFQYKILLGVIVGYTLSKEINMLGGLLGCVLGFFLLDILITVSNKGDTDKFVTDLSSIYDSLKIQTKAGVFITNAIGECYLISQNTRLKIALAELNADLFLKKDLNAAMNKFNSKFNCSHIDSFCMTIKQSAESGQSSQALNDLASQIKEINLVLSDQKGNRIKTRLMFLQIGVFLGMIMILIYSTFIDLSSGLMNF